MTITQLQYVLAVAEHKNFTLAAQSCFVTQPTLSMQIQKLEEELDVQIFDRSKKPIQLTEIGRSIVNQAKKIVNESDRIQDIIDQQKGEFGGDFRIAIIPTIMPTLLPMFLNHFIKKYPKINLIIEELNTDELLIRLKKGSLDAAIAATPLYEDGIKEIPLYYEPFVGYFPENHINYKLDKITPDNLGLDDILLLQDGHCFRDGILNICKKKHINNEKNFHLESGSFETLIKLADEGLGYTLLPYLHTLNLTEEEKKKLRFFVDPQPAREISVLYSKSELKLHIIEAFKNSIQAVIRGAITFHDVKIISPKINKGLS